jgi:CDGSH-type Zn-finger protein/uncharacterized Fe-S cluster protein YjdI
MGDKTQVYEGKNITVYFEARRCIHSGKCVHGLPAVFRASVKGPWIDPDAADADTLAALIHTCPSGALTYRREDDKAEEAAPAINTITIEKDGPLVVHADFSLNGEKTGCFRATLCRCGASKNKPYCDNAHKTAGFRSDGKPGVGNLDANLRTGPVDIAILPGGPLVVSGCCEIRDADGAPVSRTDKVALCRCGASRNKPFCDGSHTQIGFTS